MTAGDAPRSLGKRRFAQPPPRHGAPEGPGFLKGAVAFRGMAHYAEAFSVHPGQCFGFLHNGVGHAKHCPEPVNRHGTFVDGKGKGWDVDACNEHAEAMIGP